MSQLVGKRLVSKLRTTDIAVFDIVVFIKPKKKKDRWSYISLASQIVLISW